MRIIGSLFLVLFLFGTVFAEQELRLYNEKSLTIKEAFDLLEHLSLSKRVYILSGAESITTYGNIVVINKGDEIRAVSLPVEEEKPKDTRYDIIYGEPEYIKKNDEKFNPENCESYNGLYWKGLCYGTQGDTEKELATIKEAAEKAVETKRYDDAHYYFKEIGEYDKAKEYAKTAAELYEKSYEYANAEIFYTRAEMKDKALEMRKKSNEQRQHR